MGDRGERRLPTLLLTRTEIEALLVRSSLVGPMQEGFIAHSCAHVRAQRVRSPLPGPGTATVLFPGTLAGIRAYTVKVHAKFPAETPAIRGVICLHDVDNGDLLAVMDSTYITAVRTGLTGALAAHRLAQPDADTVAVIGAGMQGAHQICALAALRSLTRVLIYDVIAQRAEALAQTVTDVLRVRAEVAASAAAALTPASIVLVATWSRTPFIRSEMVNAGVHITTLGPDEPGKAEVDADLIRKSLFFCDDCSLAVQCGALNSVGLDSSSVDAEFGEVLAGTHPGRTSPDDITIYGGVGLPFQDLVVAWQVYNAALAQGLGRKIDFLA